MPDPAYVQLPTDSTDNKNKIRSFSLVDEEGNTVLQQVSVLADSEGRVVAVDGLSLRVATRLDAKFDEVIEELRALRQLLNESLRPKGRTYGDL